MTVESTPIRVLLVDDHAMVRLGLAAILRNYDDLDLLGEADSGEEAVQLCERLHPDVVLMDLVMPGMDGATATKAIRERCPRTRVLALTSYKEGDLVERALQAGAIGYLLKNVTGEDLAEAIRAAHVGRPTVAPEATRALDWAEKLEALRSAILEVPPDLSALSELLGGHVPGMFAGGWIEIRVFPDQTILHAPADWPAVSESVWAWLRDTRETRCFYPGEALPWSDERPGSNALLGSPILGIDSAEPLGGIYLEHQDPTAVTDALPAIESLAMQISLALYSIQARAQALAHQRVAQELAVAGEIQAGLLPDAPPDVLGWQIAATLEPARETSGDFYDFIQLPQGRLGIVIADVSDKGAGAALFMALTRTLIRTYAGRHVARSDLVLSAVNRRILMETHAGLFVSVFYAILDPASGALTYCNAGHNPQYLLRAQEDIPLQVLSRTGMVLGVGEGAWEQMSLQIAPGDVLLLYTDGVTEAQDREESFFGEVRLLEVIEAHVGRSAQEIQDALIAAVRRFTDDASQSDDITVVVVVRDDSTLGSGD